MRWYDRFLNLQRRTWLAATPRSIVRLSSVFALAVIGMAWGGVIYLERVEHAGAEQAALRAVDNLSRAFETQLATGLSEADRILLAMRMAYAEHPAQFDFKLWEPSNSRINSPILLLGIIGPNGILKSTSATGALKKTVDLSDLDQFKTHISDKKDKFFISRAKIGVTTNQSSIIVSRRINNTDGSFGGVVTASLDTGFFTALYGSVNLGPKSFINITGADGIIRIADKLNSKRVGLDLSKSELLNRYRLRPSGSFTTKASISDGVARLVSYRAIEKYPLILSIGLSESEIFAAADSHARVYNYAGLIISAFIVIAVLVYQRHGATVTRMADKIMESNKRLQAALSNMSQGLCMFDAEQRLIVCNKQYAGIYGLDEVHTRPGTTLREILQYRIANGNAPNDDEDYIEERIATVEARKSSEVIHQLLDGRYIAVTHKPITGGGWVTTHEDITYRKISEAKVEHLARHDTLTGLANRATLMEKIEEVNARLRRRGENFSLLMLDLDKFKQVNDTLGHPAGDVLLKEVASRLKACLRETDVLARLGGDEFAIIQSGEVDQQGAAVGLSTRIIAELGKQFSIEGNEVYVGVSIGFALAPEHSASNDELLKMADIALYSAKGSGRNCYRCFGTEMTEAMAQRHEIEGDLRHAIEKNELVLHYQPIIDARTQKVCGVEALVRWQHPTKGLIPPDQFIPLAEETGLIVAIGEWVLDTACKEAMTWPPEIKVAVNLSAKQFNDDNLASVVMYVLADTGLPPERLELEITETALIESATSVLPVLRQFKNLGISIALDDFGTGYSSLSQLTMFPFDKIKIDKSFTQKMAQRSDCAAIIAATMTLADGLNKETTAEGVETAEQCSLLRLAGVSSMQGYLFKRPGPASELDFNRVYSNKELENAA